MTPKKKSKFYAISCFILTIVFYFMFGLSEVLYPLAFAIMYLIMYKVSDYIDIRIADILVEALLPFCLIRLLILVF